jgi:hypothetical protein
VETFIVRVWTPADESAVAAGVSGLHGIVQNPATGIETRFASEAELTGVLRSMLAAGVDQSDPGPL